MEYYLRAYGSIIGVYIRAARAYNMVEVCHIWAEVDVLRRGKDAFGPGVEGVSLVFRDVSLTFRMYCLDFEQASLLKCRWLIYLEFGGTHGFHKAFSHVLGPQFDISYISRISLDWLVDKRLQQALLSVSMASVWIPLCP